MVHSSGGGGRDGETRVLLLESTADTLLKCFHCFFCAHCEQHVAQSDADFEPISAGKKQEEVLLVKKNFEGNNVADFSMFKVRHGGCHWYLDNFLLVDLCLFSCASSRFLQHVYNLFVC